MTYLTRSYQALIGSALSLLVISSIPRADDNLKFLLSESFVRPPPSIAMDQIKAKLVARTAGFVDQFLKGTDSISISGWAADISAKGTARSVHVFVNGRPMSTLVPQQVRPDVAAAFGIPEVAPSGFSVVIKAAPQGSVQVFAELQDGSFAELGYPAKP
jgi:hypothetical protein